MAIPLPENAGYVPSITRLEKTYKARGGAVVIDEMTGDPTDGDLNLPLQQLASRTKALKDIVDSLPTTTAAPVTEVIVSTAGEYLNVGAGDNGKFYTINITDEEGSCTIIPATVGTLPLGWEVHITQLNPVYSLEDGDGVVVVTGVETAGDYANMLRTQYSVATIKKVSSDTLIMFGDLLLTSDIPNILIDI